MWVWMTAAGILFLPIATALGAAFVFFFVKSGSRRRDALFLGFTSGVMLAASVWSLILPALEQAQNGWGRYAFIPVCIGVLVGAAFLTLSDYFLPSAEKTGKNVGGFGVKNPMKLFIAITLHNVPEGLAVGFAFGRAWALGAEQAFALAVALAMGIGIQNIPEGAAVALPISASYQSKAKGFWFGAASGVCELVFGIVGCVLAAYLMPLQPWLLAFAAGAMLFVVAEELLPSADSSLEGKGEFTWSAWGATVGFLFMMVLDVALG